MTKREKVIRFLSDNRVEINRLMGSVCQIEFKNDIVKFIEKDIAAQAKKHDEVIQESLFETALKDRIMEINGLNKDIKQFQEKLDHCQQMNQQLAYENEDLKKQVEHYQVSTIQQHTKETGWVTIKDNNYQEFIETLFASGYAVKIEPLKDRKMKITISEREVL